MQLHTYLHFCKVIEILGVRWLGMKLVQIQSSKKITASSGVAIGIGREPLRKIAWCERDEHGALAGYVPDQARPSHATDCKRWKLAGWFPGTTTKSGLAHKLNIRPQFVDFFFSWGGSPAHTMWAGGYYHYSADRYLSRKMSTSLMARWLSLIIHHCRWVLLDAVH